MIIFVNFFCKILFFILQCKLPQYDMFDHSIINLRQKKNRRREDTDDRSNPVRV